MVLFNPHSRTDWRTVLFTAALLALVASHPLIARGGGPDCVGGLPISPAVDSGTIYDAKSSPGLNCIPSGYTSVNFANQPYYEQRGGLCNLDLNKQLKVRCPIIRDHIIGEGQSHRVELPCVQVHFFQSTKDTTSTPECTLYTRSQYGAFFDWATDPAPPQAAVPGGRHTTSQMHLNQASNNSYYYVTCNIPRRPENGPFQCLRSYDWYEHRQTD